MLKICRKLREPKAILEEAMKKQEDFKRATVAEETKTKLVLVGDGKQLQDIEIGSGFQAIGSMVGEARLSEIIRQKSEENQRAVRALSQGFANEALQHYAEIGNLDISPTREKAKEQILTVWTGVGTRLSPRSLLQTGRADLPPAMSAALPFPHPALQSAVCSITEACEFCFSGV